MSRPRVPAPALRPAASSLLAAPVFLAASLLLAGPAGAVGVDTPLARAAVEPHVDPAAGLLLPVAWVDYGAGSAVAPVAAGGLAGCYRFFCFAAAEGAAAGQPFGAAAVCIAGVALCGGGASAGPAGAVWLCYHFDSPPLYNGCWARLAGPGAAAVAVCYHGRLAYLGCAAALEGPAPAVLLVQPLPPRICGYLGPAGACAPAGT